MDPRLKNLIRVGKVTAIDPDTSKRVRVLFEDRSDANGEPTVSYWLNILYTDSTWLPDIDEMVVCIFLPSGNAQGFVVGRIWY